MDHWTVCHECQFIKYYTDVNAESVKSLKIYVREFQ